MKQIIFSSDAPKPIGPYSQAVLSGNTLFMSGQVAINPNTGQMVQHDIQSETRQVMDNIQQVLSAAGMDFSAVVKTTIFLSDMALFQEVNEVYAGYFTGDFPARETVQVAGLPLKANVEISMVAIK